MNDPDVLTVTVTATGLAAAGEIDTSTVSVLTVALESHMLDSSEGDVVLNMAAVEFIDSSGLRVLIDAHRTTAQAGRLLVISEPSIVVRRLLEVSGLHTHLHVVP